MNRLTAFLLVMGVLLAACRAQNVAENISWDDDYARADRASKAKKPIVPEQLPKSFPIPKIEYRVDDRAGVLSEVTRNSLQIRLVDLFVDTGIPVTLLSIQSAAPVSVEQYAVHTAIRNKIEGILILLAVEQRDLRVLICPKAAEPTFQDEVNALITERVRPHLQDENFATALTQTVRLIDAALRK